MTDVNPETIARYEKAFGKYAKNGSLHVLDIAAALEEAKEDYTEDDIFDALEVMGIKDDTRIINLKKKII